MSILMMTTSEADENTNPAASTQVKSAEESPSHIAFMSNRDGNWEIYVMSSDGSHQKRLTTNEADDTWPSLSPDGQQVAFVSKTSDESGIYVVGIDGTNLHRISEAQGQAKWPVWSPDGGSIAFSWQKDKDDGIALAKTAGSGQSLLTVNRLDLYPTCFSIDSQIIFLSIRDGGYQYYRMESDGSGLEKLEVGLPLSKHKPAEVMGVFVDVDITGMLIQYFTQRDGIIPFEDTGNMIGEFPRWSPDGSQIAFHSNREGNMEIFVMNSDRSQLKRLTNNDAYDMFPTWSPDGTKIAFQSTRNGDADIYVMNVDGSGQIRLTTDSGLDALPSWRP
jgi:Tol biopolymer transport system component